MRDLVGPAGTCMQRPAQNSAHRLGGQNATGAPSRVSYSLGRGRGEWPLQDSEWDVTVLGSSGCPGGEAFRDLPKNIAHKSGGQNALGASMGGIRGTWNGARICEGPHGAQ